MEFPSLPTSKSAVLLPYAAQNLQGQLTEIAKQPEGKATWTQFALAKATASVAVALFAAVDALFHAACAVLKTVPTLAKVTVAKWTGLDKHMSPAFNGKEWLGHVENVYKNAVMAAFALGVGLYAPSLVASFGRDIGLMNDAGKSTGGAPNAGTSSTVSAVQESSK